MAKIATLEGRGHLLVNDEDLGEVDYEIDIFVERGLKDGRGHLVADFMVLEKAFTGRNVKLQLRGGKEVTIVIKRTQGDRAEILTSGPIPGY